MCRAGVQTHYNSVAGYNTWEDFAWEVLYRYTPIHTYPRQSITQTESLILALKELITYLYLIFSFNLYDGVNIC
jgi:hypothetical protein